MAAVPDGAPLSFFHELDEGLWFYLREHRLAPVPGSQPRFNDAYDRLDEGRVGDALDAPGLVDRSKPVLAAWLQEPGRAGSYLLVRDKVHQALRAELEAATTPLLVEPRRSRNSLVLLQVAPASPPQAAGLAAEPAVR